MHQLQSSPENPYGQALTIEPNRSTLGAWLNSLLQSKHFLYLLCSPAGEHAITNTLWPRLHIGY